MKSKTSDQSIGLQLEAQQAKLLKTPISQPSPIWSSKRFLVALLMAMCHLNSAFSRNNISIALIEMTYPKEIRDGNTTKIQPPEFYWDSTTIGLTLSIFYYGGLVSILGSYFVSRIGGATFCVLTTMSSGIITILHPITLQYSFFLFLVCRFLVGISECLLNISITEVSSQWTPKNERSKLTAISEAGINVGVAIVHGVCAFVAHYWGWQMIFYVTGSISLITSSVCFIFVKNRPSDDKRISKEELMYIQERTANSTKKQVKHPYWKIISSPVIWALLVDKFAMMAAMTFIGTFLPMYVKDITNKDIKEVGIISSIPNAVIIFMLPICGILLDYGKSNSISETLMHKILIGGSFILTGILFASAAMISNFTVSIISFILIQTFQFIVAMVSQIILISIAPNSSSIIAGLSTVVTALSSIGTRNTIASMTTDHTLEEWDHCILIMSGISLLGGVFFILCGSSETQPWSIASSYDQDDQKTQTDTKLTK
ncbi:sialin-like [Planococcus citri]|uniref:sialin-like n=1 Tax=Planococcus citri TaxID=170843 RepID=UPI0031F8F8F4